MGSTIKRAWKRWKKRTFGKLADRDYIESYAKDTDRRVAKDPQRAIGGLWDEMGKLQFDFLVAQGLQRQHKMLDIGCGTLRGGRHFIPYLGVGHYTGIDISRGALDAGEALCRQEGLLSQEPRLIQVPEGRLDFVFIDDRFDFLLAQSVFSHLRASHIQECLDNIHKVMLPDARFFFTFFEEERGASVRGYKSFGYPFEVIAEMAGKAGLVLTRHPEYLHPRQQHMVEARVATS